MAAAATAMVFAARHNQLEIHLGHHGITEGLPETGPTGATVEFGLGAEQGQLATGADKGAVAMLLIEGAGKGALGAFLAQHGKSSWAQALLPCGFTEIPGWIKGLGGCRCLPGVEKWNQGHQGGAETLEKTDDHGASGMERHAGSVHPAGAEYHGQDQEDGEQRPADAVKGVLSAASARKHGAPAGGQATHAITLGAVQQDADDHQDAAEHPDPGDGGAKHADNGSALAQP